MFAILKAFGPSVVKGALGVWNKRKEREAAIYAAETDGGVARGKRKWSLIADIIIALMVLAPYGIIIVTPFTGSAFLEGVSAYINTGVQQLPNQLYILMYMVVGGNFGVSVSNIIKHKKALK